MRSRSKNSVDLDDGYHLEGGYPGVVFCDNVPIANVWVGPRGGYRGVMFGGERRTRGWFGSTVGAAHAIKRIHQIDQRRAARAGQRTR